VDDSTARLVAAVDAERRQLERRLHDGIQQQLVALAVNLQLLDQLAETDPVAAKTLLGEIRNDVREALAELRLLAGRIYPPLSGLRGLAASLRAAAADAGMPVRIDVSSTQCGDDAAAAVYACCRQALDEIAEHGGSGGRVTIDVRDERGALVFEVVGSAVDDAFSRTLNLMEARIAARGGRLALVAGQDGAARLVGTIPPA
jgi:signal transduction histidine kinase